MKVGLTGNIGSGKSTAARIFKSLGIPVFYADIQAKQLYADPEVKYEVVALCGNQVLDNDDEISFQKLGAIVFNDSEKLRQLNAIIHPKVREKYWKWLEYYQDKPYTVQEAAIMVESGLYKKMDILVVVTAPQQQRLQRILERESITEEQIRKRMQRQLPEDELIKYADFIVKNDEHTLLIPQILSVHQSLIKKMR
ncbi:MAG TPA: dephospho-CoA kinase [Bacteroidales bacterium]|nr:dephospho-CoA kinase [Bacteroidales bacterium]